ncbi:glycoside hydrolase family 76 protein [Corynebacterium mendelii]|uniref:Glycoside hydrolase family 76 n=1 Tax=Corynebacterium mendelii TaxID=2765362 RepID=A0A939E4C8_9CORY|nr:glycoside hydrolase family 76 [Corynebacterium mendelii]
MHEKWAHRADLAEAAINERHATRLWGLPGTNLAVVAWPPGIRQKVFYRWHYWWQAHYLDCLIDAASRRPTPARLVRIKRTARAIRIRNIRRLCTNAYHDDRAWLALSLGRINQLPKISAPGAVRALRVSVTDGIDPLRGVIPWKKDGHFFNVPTNGPAAIMCARGGQLATAATLVDWVFDHLIDDRGLVMDGMRCEMAGEEIVADIHPYCQGVMIGACVELVNGFRAQAGLAPDAGLDTIDDKDLVDTITKYTTLCHNLVHAVARDMATPAGVIDAPTNGGDGGLFKGILMRYLAEVAVSLPRDTRRNRAARKIAARLVEKSAESVWNNRLEIDGLPIFAADWTRDARLPRNTGVVGHSVGGAVSGSTIAERDLSVQLSGWMAIEAAAAVAAAGMNS